MALIDSRNSKSHYPKPKQKCVGWSTIILSRRETGKKVPWDWLGYASCSRRLQREQQGESEVQRFHVGAEAASPLSQGFQTGWSGSLTWRIASACAREWGLDQRNSCFIELVSHFFEGKKSRKILGNLGAKKVPIKLTWLWKKMLSDMLERWGSPHVNNTAYFTVPDLKA